LSLRIQRDFPQYYPYFRLTSFTYMGQTIRTHNRLLGRYQGTDGIKTGYIAASGFNLTTSALRGEKRVVGVVLGAASNGSRNKYMMNMLDGAFPKCVNGAMIAAAAGTSEGAINPIASTLSGGTADVNGTTSKTVSASQENAAAPDPKVLEAKIEETAVASTEEPDDPDAQATTLPAKLPFAAKKVADTSSGEATLVITDPTWNIQIGAYPKKEDARQKLQEIRASGFHFLNGKPAFTVEVQKGSETVYRARFSGFTQKTAKAACAQLSKKGQTCLTLSPQS
jgi:D-alanyl-D-alanine carboxypeptidase